MAHLLAASGDVDPNAKGETLMHIAAAAPTSDRCLQILLDEGGGGGGGGHSVNCRTATGKSPLHLAAVHGECHVESVIDVSLFLNWFTFYFLNSCAKIDLL